MEDPWNIDSNLSHDKLTKLGDALEQRCNGQKKLRKEVFQLLPNLSSGSFVLDLGSGVGHSTRDLKRRYPDCEVVGIEPREEFVKKAKANSQGLKLTYRVGSAYNLPGVQDGSCALIYLGTVLVHIHRSDQKNVLKHLRSKLKPGGYLVIFENDNTKHEFGVSDFDLLRLPPKYMAFNPSRNRWTCRQAPGWLKEAGYVLNSNRFFTVSEDSSQSYGANLIRRAVATMVRDDLISMELGEELRREISRRAKAGTLLITLTYYLGIASKPMKNVSKL